MRIGICFFQFLSIYLITISIASLSGCAPDYVVSEDEMLYLEAKALYDNREFDDAIEIFKTICKEYSWSNVVDNSNYYIGASWLGKATDENGDLTAPIYLPEAKEGFLKVESSSSRYVDALYGIGEIHYLAEDYDSALYYCNNIYQEYPDNGKADNAVLILGNSYRKTGEYDSSVVWYEIIISDYKNKTAYDNGLYWAADYYFDRKSVETNKLKATEYYEEYLSIADCEDEKYEKAVTRLEYLEGLE